MKRFENIRGIVYDLDGTIIDSAPVHASAWRAAGDKFGVQITSEFLELQKGRTNEEAARYLLDPLGKLAVLEEFVSVKVDYANQHADESRYFGDFTMVCERFHERGIPVWICTSSPKEFCLGVYHRFSQLEAFSSRTVWREMYQNGKGEGLLQAFRKMDIDPKYGIFVGDAPSDWSAAQQVGCLFVCYRSLAIERHRELLSLLPS